MAFWSSAAFAQDIKKVRDFGLWTSVGVDYQIKKNWNLTFKQDFRLADNVSEFAKATSEFGVQYKINKQFKIAANVRYAYDRKGDKRLTNDIRYNFDFKYKLKLGESSQLRYRFRFQNNFVDLFTYYDEHTRKSNARNQIEYHYKIKDHSLSLGAELFREFVVYRKPRFNVVRFMLGDQIKTQLGEIEYSLNYARELNAKYPMNFFFIKLGYTFNFNHG